MSRALRKHHEERLKRKTRKRVEARITHRRVTDKDVGVAFQAPKAQSKCRCCQNPRKEGLKTRQEKRAEEMY